MPEAAALRVVDQVGRREVAVASGDQVDDGPAGGGRAIAGLAEGRIDRGAGRVHAVMILSINTRVQSGRSAGRGTPRPPDLRPAV